ncbi:tRNA (adenosine(37)-N6)-threonylcarbamoyltransferase complex dimerization subunit type 1 TsaB [Brevibacterium spongiae]|uniref:tRNA (Adenosine(37)-N6)-threonylcarbamoyltransferase complex dimerization subunit type 1 TsaB n=1 Tax=Brevibacterium spongiae TaxID=2909672 RepID=A0ABY5SQ03_9MICO|nr:tRNA (adenosine(37)-N6)-threonylcarbamoyltransferase complex dimerization subunit type 1 TsaB [Brevibacterium spongiae]UVI35136.1 tRNA (adenosine(37)-N6)-threonylcarbamoyltransferase complex dimerization subunit type 1 TsaB [Brevibacterium spongiae]
MIILAIDTSQSASVALVDADTGDVIAAEQADDQRRHVEFIGPALARVLAAQKAPELVVVGIGPGPFTGLRVGIAAGIAVGQARGIPVRGLLSQAAVAEEFVRTSSQRATTADDASRPGADAASGTAGGAPVLIASDARRKEVYFSVYDSSDASLSAGPFVAKPAEVAAVLADHSFALDDHGDALTGHADALRSGDASADAGEIRERLGRGFLLYPEILGAATREPITDPRAEFLALAAARDIAAGRSLSEPVPEYLREPDAKATPVRESSLK